MGFRSQFHLGLLIVLNSAAGYASGPYFNPSSRSIENHRKQLVRELGLVNSDRLNVVVVGGGRGIGRGFSEYFAAMGANLLIASPGSAEKSADEIQGDYENANVVGEKVDFTSASDVNNFFESEKHSEFLSNSHIAIFSGGLGAIDDQWNQVQQMMDLKTKGARIFHERISELMLRRVRKAKKKPNLAGYILPISSVGGLFPLPYPMEYYGKSNAAVIEQIDELNSNYGRKIKSVAIASTYVDTDMSAVIPGLSKLFAKLAADSPAFVAERTLDIVLNPSSGENKLHYYSSNVIIPGSPANAIMTTIGSAVMAYHPVSLLMRAAKYNPVLRIQAAVCAKILEGLGDIIK